MPATSTLAEIRHRDSVNGDSASFIWVVINAATEREAIDAQPEPGTQPIIKKNGAHPRNSFLKVRDNDAYQDGGPLTWIVTAEFAIPPTGNFIIPPTDPLDRPARISWRTGKITTRCDVSIENKPLVNSAGDALDPPYERVLSVRYLTITKWFTTYDYDRARHFENTVNSNDFVSGGQTFLAGEVYCDSIEPTSEYDSTATRIEIAHNLMINQDLRKDGNTSGQPFQLHVKDQGRRGWYNSGTGNSKRGEFYYKTESGGGGTPVVEDIPLDGTGKPLDTDILVSPDGESFYAPQPCPFLPDLELNVDPDYSTTNVKILSFNIVRAVDYSTLGL